MGILVIDVGTSGVRAVVVDTDGHLVHEAHDELLPRSPAPGRVEFDPAAMAAAALALAREAVEHVGAVDAVGITNQRSSTVAWDRATGDPVGPGLGWQDLRTEDRCLDLLAEGLLVGPNFCLTKAAWLVDHADRPARDLCVGTVDTWIAWHLSEGALHVTDPSNASAGGPMWSAGSGDWDVDVLAAAGVPAEVMPEIVPSAGVVGVATALPGAPPIAGIAGDQQAALVGQGCLAPGTAKLTLGTGGMLDVYVGRERPPFELTGPRGCMAMAAAHAGGPTEWILEAVMLAAGTNVEWLRDGLGAIATPAHAHEVAAACASSDGVLYVPALLGLGTPYWDFGATGTFLGITRGTGRPQMVRAVLEGVAQRGADLLDAAEADGAVQIDVLQVDGGMTANPTLLQALADAVARPVAVAPVTETTALGAAFLAGRAVGVWDDWDDVAPVWGASRRVEPKGSFDRDRWREACRRSACLAGDTSRAAEDEEVPSP